MTDVDAAVRGGVAVNIDVGRDIYGLRPARIRMSPPAPPAGTRGLHPCVACAGTRVHRDVPVTFAERWVLPVAGLRPYRCVDCGHRFYDRPRGGRVRVGLRKGASPRLPEASRA